MNLKLFAQHILSLHVCIVLVLYLYKSVNVPVIQVKSDIFIEYEFITNEQKKTMKYSDPSYQHQVPFFWFRLPQIVHQWYKSIIEQFFKHSGRNMVSLQWRLISTMGFLSGWDYLNWLRRGVVIESMTMSWPQSVFDLSILYFNTIRHILAKYET